jgi:signal transduction histidine kinase
VLILFKDITEIRRLQRFASRSDRMKELGEMAAQLAHQIRNPLGGIKGFASLLKRDLASHPPMQQMAQAIIEGTDSLNAIVTQVLDYARPLQPHFEKINLLNLIEDIQKYVEAQEVQQRHNIKFFMHTALTQAWITADSQLLRLALMNLITNAIQAMPQGGNLTLSIQKKRHHFILTVSDTGVGISKENMNKIFSPFFTTKPQGNGFGLAEVFKVIQEHDGSIKVSSLEGKGTSFTIKLPLTYEEKNL